jgi:hypothetical protein
MAFLYLSQIANFIVLYQKFPIKQPANQLLNREFCLVDRQGLEPGTP